MKMSSAIDLQAESIVKQDKTKDSRKMNPLLSTHYASVQKVVKQLKDSGDIIQMSIQAKPLKGEDYTSGYQTVIYHGMTRSSEKKTFIQTLPDGTIKMWTEAVG